MKCQKTLKAKKEKAALKPAQNKSILMINKKS